MPLVVDPDGIELPTIRELVDPAGLRIVEVGCGDGRITFQYAADAAHVTAFDTDEEGILSARAALPTALRERVRFELADARSFDAAEWVQRGIERRDSLGGIEQGQS